MEKEEIGKAVRERYGNIVKQGSSCCGPAKSCWYPGRGTLLNFLILSFMNFPSLGDEVRNGARGESQLSHQLRVTCFAALFRQIAVKGPCLDDLPNSAATQNIFGLNAAILHHLLHGFIQRGP
jgi:hypothetical protein